MAIRLFFALIFTLLNDNSEDGETTNIVVYLGPASWRLVHSISPLIAREKQRHAARRAPFGVSQVKIDASFEKVMAASLVR